MSRHYLDHASTSPTRPEVIEAMGPWLTGGADPGRVHTEGRMARVAIEEAREHVAGLLGTRPRQVVFTSGGTEAINTATWGAVRASEGGLIICSAVEHSAVRDSSERLACVVPAPVDSRGLIDSHAVEAALDDADRQGQRVALVHCQLANHEVATIQPAAEVAHLCRDRGVLCHVDAAAAAGHVQVDVGDLGAHLVSVSAHKLGGPRGVGALVTGRGLRLEPLLVGGEQERARRGGLENTPAIVGFGEAARLLSKDGRLAAEAAESRRHTDRLIGIAASLEGVAVYGDPEARVPHIVCLGIEGVEAEAVLLGLDQAGIAAHSGSACSSETLAPSPVLEAMGVESERSLRLSVGWSTVDGDIDALASALPQVIDRLRALRA